MFDNNPDAKWSREFGELGDKRVRELMLSTAWDREKRVAARTWLEKQDVKAWQSKQSSSAEGERFSLKKWIRDNKRWISVILGLGVAFMMMGRFMRW
jgi:hypothetical protein